jgi:hypothetical protein
MTELKLNDLARAAIPIAAILLQTRAYDAECVVETSALDFSLYVNLRCPEDLSHLSQFHDGPGSVEQGRKSL